MKFSRAALVPLLVFAAAWTASGRGGWSVFRSVRFRYTVRYPGSWFLFTTELQPRLDYLDILNFPPSQRVEGVVLKEGGAEISVAAAPSRNETIDQRIGDSTKLGSRIRKRRVSLRATSRSGCTEIVEVTWLSGVGPGEKLSSTDYYCATRNGLYAISLTNWQGDPNEPKLRATALKVALSLRSW